MSDRYNTARPEGDGEKEKPITDSIAKAIREGIGAEAGPTEGDYAGVFKIWVDVNMRPWLQLREDGTLVGKFQGLAEAVEATEELAAEVTGARGTCADISERLGKVITSGGLLDRHHWGEWLLRSFGWKRNLLEADTPSGKLSIALIGDSWTQQATRFPQPFARKLKSPLSDGGAGFCGFSYFSDTGAINGSADFLTISGSRDPANWTRVTSGAGLVYAVDGSHLRSSTVGAWVDLSITTPQNTCRIHYRQQPGGGVIRYQVDGGAWTSVNTDGAEGYGIKDVTLPFAACTMRIEVESAGSAGVIINGIDAQRTTGVCVHKLAHSGGRVTHFSSNTNAAHYAAGLGYLELDLAVIMFATNEQIGNVDPAIYASNLEILIGRIRGARPLCDIILVCPARNGSPSPAYPMDAYRDAAYGLAVRLGVAFVDLTKVFGAFSEYKYSTDGSTRNLFNADNIHPEPARGGRVLTDAIIRFLYSL